MAPGTCSSSASPFDTYHWYDAGAECQWIFYICVVLTVQFFFVAIALLSGLDAPYGRYNDKAAVEQMPWFMKPFTACNINPKLAWALQESPNLIMAVCCWRVGVAECKQSMGNLLALLCFTVHYANRTLIFPFRMRGGKPTPLLIMLWAAAFCSVNGYIQCRSLTAFMLVPGASWTAAVGSVVWLAGFLVNYHADHILRNLRKPGEVGYKIPRGGMFEYVSGANFFGEIIEWIGFAILTGGSLPAATFAFTTAMNIGPRAIAHHKWYLTKFEDYPPQRRAVIPFLL